MAFHVQTNKYHSIILKQSQIIIRESIFLGLKLWDYSLVWVSKTEIEPKDLETDRDKKGRLTETERASQKFKM